MKTTLKIKGVAIEITAKSKKRIEARLSLRRHFVKQSLSMSGSGT